VFMLVLYLVSKVGRDSKAEEFSSRVVSASPTLSEAD
jgi:hypothetical protein